MPIAPGPTSARNLTIPEPIRLRFVAEQFSPSSPWSCKRSLGGGDPHSDITPHGRPPVAMFVVLLPVRHMYSSRVSQGSNLAMPTEPLRGSDMISVRELADMRSAGKKHTVLDVREARELDVCQLEGALHIPMAEIAAQTDNLPTDHLLVVICHHGARSQMVVDFFRTAGFDNEVNLDGGIDAWACDVDPSMPRYQ